MTTNLPSTLTNLASSLQVATSSIQAETGNELFIKFTKTGEWVYGSGDTEIEENSTWAINPESFIQGFQAWSDDSELLGEEYDFITNPPVIKGDLKVMTEGRGWSKLVGFSMVCLNGEDEGTTVLFKTTSVGGVKAVSAIMQAVFKRITNEPESGAFVPVVDLSDDSYKHKKYGKIFTPVIDVVRWTDASDTKVEEPVAETKVAEPEVEPEVAEEPAPTKRRRRRATA